MRVLLVEDDTMIGESLSHGLKGSGYAVDWAKDGQVAEESLATQEYHLMLLDLGLPKQSGLALLQKIRSKGHALPVLILTARDSVADRVGGLDAGADDYLVKPFALEELEARMRALLRRKNGKADLIMECGHTRLNPATKELTHKDRNLLLSAREYALMHALMESPGKVISRHDLEEKMYGWNKEVSSNAVEVHIHALRRKLGADMIRNIRGLGYLVAKS